MLAVVLALGAAVSYGVGDFFGGLSSRRAHVLTVLALSQLAGAAAVAIWVGIAVEDFLDARAAAAAATAGVCGVVGLGALYRGMARGAMGVVAPISAVSAAIPFAVGVARGERPSALQLAGCVAALAGLALRRDVRCIQSRNRTLLAIVGANSIMSSEPPMLHSASGSGLSRTNSSMISGATPSG